MKYLRILADALGEREKNVKKYKSTLKNFSNTQENKALFVPVKQDDTHKTLLVNKEIENQNNLTKTSSNKELKNFGCVFKDSYEPSEEKTIFIDNEQKNVQNTFLTVKATEKYCPPKDGSSDRKNSNDKITSSSSTKEGIIVPLSPLTPNQKALERHRNILILELPFKTDSLSVNQALVEKYKAITDKKASSTEEEIQNIYPLKDEEFSTDNTEIRYKHTSLRRLLESIVLVHISYDSKGNSTTSIEKSSEIDYESPIVQQEILKKIDEKHIKNNSKRTERCMANKVFHRNNIKGDSAPNRGVPVKDLARFFSYLEKRCFKSKSHCKDYLEVRLLYYSALPLNELKKLTLQNMDLGNTAIMYEDYSFPIPFFFIRLAYSLYKKGEALFNKNSKSMNKFLEQTSKAAGIPKIGIKELRNSLRDIYYRENFCVEYLPKR